MTIIGIDADTRRLAYAVVMDGVVIHRAIIERANSTGVIHAMYDSMVRDLAKNANRLDAVIVMERPFWGGAKRDPKAMGFGALNEVAGEIKAAMRAERVQFETVKPYSWQWSALGIRRDRRDLKALSRDKFMECNDHQADATGIAVYGDTILRSGGHLVGPSGGGGQSKVEYVAKTEVFG